jgi:excisionase family DNA binding protein
MTPDATLWTIRDAATYLSVSPRTVERARSRGDFPPAIRIGRTVRFEAAAVMDWANTYREAA